MPTQRELHQYFLDVQKQLMLHALLSLARCLSSEYHSQEEEQSSPLNPPLENKPAVPLALALIEIFQLEDQS